MSNLDKAMEIERQLRAEHKFFYGTFIPKIQELDFKSVDEYLEQKKGYAFTQWKPEIYQIPIDSFAGKVNDAITNEACGIYIPCDDELHAYHGNDNIDYDVCNELGVKVVELGYRGGTIIGSNKDLSMLIILPRLIMVDEATVTNKFVEIISKYVSNTTLEGNDILVNGEKIAGTTWRDFDNISVWTIQVSFADYSEYIEKICQKPAVKKPAYIDNNLLTRDQLEQEILAWLRKE